MEFINEGNLGRADLLNRHMSKKYFFDDSNISKEELEEISYQLGKFNYLLSNLFLYQNSLKNDGYGALSSILEELEPFYRNYDKDKCEEVKNVF